MNELAANNPNCTDLSNPGMPNLGGIGREDLQIPQLSLVQKMSDLVDSQKAKAGDIYDTLEQVVIADEKEVVEFIPIHTQKAWRVYEIEKPGEQKYLKTVGYDHTNANWRFEAVLDGKKIKNQLVMSWFVLLVEQVKRGEAIPYQINFKGMSMDAAKKLSTLIAKGSFLGLPAYGKTYTLGSEKKSNDKATFSVFQVMAGRVTTPDEIKAAKQWLGMFDKPVVTPVEPD